MKSRVLLVGGYRKAKTLAKSLLKKGYRVTVINDDHEACQGLAEIDGLKVIKGDGTLPSVLLDAGADHCQIAIAMTSKDENNLVICQLCKKRFNVKKTISLVTNPNKTDFFLKMGVDRVICAVEKITAIIEQQANVEQIANVVAIAEGKIKVTEMRIEAGAEVIGKKIKDINLPHEVVVSCILRADDSMIPRGNTQLLAEDTLILISEKGGEEKAIKILSAH